MGRRDDSGSIVLNNKSAGSQHDSSSLAMTRNSGNNKYLNDIRLNKSKEMNNQMK